MVPHRPFFIGSPGCVRSNACTWDFSSTHKTNALSGGFRYKPTTSVNFSTNCLSLDTLKVLIRWGCNPCASHTLATEEWLTPTFFPKVLVLQCVASKGVLCKVISTIFLTFLSLRRFMLGPWGAFMVNPSMPFSPKRLRHNNTVGRDVFNAEAIALLDFPSAAKRHTRDRRTIRCGVVPAFTHFCKVSFCSSIISNGSFAFHIMQ